MQEAWGLLLLPCEIVGVAPNLDTTVIRISGFEPRAQGGPAGAAFPDRDGVAGRKGDDELDERALNVSPHPVGKALALSVGGIVDVRPLEITRGVHEQNGQHRTALIGPDRRRRYRLRVRGVNGSNEASAQNRLFSISFLLLIVS